MTDGEVLDRLYERVREARKKHPFFARDEIHALDVIGDEFNELLHAIASEPRERQIDEALDVIATCFRFIAGEHLA